MGTWDKQGNRENGEIGKLEKMGSRENVENWGKQGNGELGKTG